jgi:hypothetical protein
MALHLPGSRPANGERPDTPGRSRGGKSVEEGQRVRRCPVLFLPQLLVTVGL